MTGKPYGPKRSHVLIPPIALMNCQALFVQRPADLIHTQNRVAHIAAPGPHIPVG